MVLQKIRQWSEEAERGLAQALGPPRERAELIAGVMSGGLECYRLWDGEAYMVTRLEPGVLTVCCYQGRRADDAAAWLVGRCAELGISTIRFHTSRPALARLLAWYHPRHVEHVYEIPVPRRVA